jgi:hypothetical protein
MKNLRYIEVDADFARFERALLFSDALRPLNSDQVVAGDLVC